MKTLTHPKKAVKSADAAAPIARTHRVALGTNDLYIIRRGGNPEESRLLAGKIIAEAEKRTTGTDSRKLLSAMRNRRA